MDQPSQNRTTSRQWQMYASHRQRIERLIVPPGPGAKLCVLGAGNCNDLDLKWLTQAYREVHLVDLDPVAVKEAIERQGVNAANLHIHAPFDLTNAAAELAGELNVERCIRRVTEPPMTPWGLCDVVLSPCVLTQTIIPFRDATRDHPLAKRLRAALIWRHLNLIATSLSPGGVGAMVIDLISSQIVKDLPRIPEDQVTAAMDRLVSAAKHFRGLDPPAMIRECARLNVESVTASTPWLWHLGLHKSFIVYALTFTRV